MQPPSLTTLPVDALRHILRYLRPVDINHLHIAFPPSSSLRQHTFDPRLWHTLYRRDFRPPPPPQLRLTSTGMLDWRAAYEEAQRREQSIRRQRDRGWGFPEHRRDPPNRPGVARFAWSARLGGAELVPDSTNTADSPSPTHSTVTPSTDLTRTVLRDAAEQRERNSANHTSED